MGTERALHQLLFCFFFFYLFLIYSPYAFPSIALSEWVSDGRKQVKRYWGLLCLVIFLRAMSVSFIHVVACIKTSSFLHYFFLSHCSYILLWWKYKLWINILYELLLPPLANYFKSLLCSRNFSKCFCVY